MGDVIDVATEVVKPDRVFADVYDREYTLDGNLSSVGIVAIFKAAGVEVSRAKVALSDGRINVAMGDVYEAARTPVYDAAYATAYAAAIDDGKTEDDAKTLARTAGNQAVVDAGIVRGNAQVAWNAAKAQVVANATAQSLVKTLAEKDWGTLILKRAWRQSMAQ